MTLSDCSLALSGPVPVTMRNCAIAGAVANRSASPTRMRFAIIPPSKYSLPWPKSMPRMAAKVRCRDFCDVIRTATVFSCEGKGMAWGNLVQTCAVALALAFGASTANATVTISSNQTQNMTCSGGVCRPTATKAVLNVGDLTTMLASGNVTVTTTGSGGVQSEDISLDSAVSWSSGATLKLDAYRSLTIDKPISVLGSGGLALVTNDGGSDGALVLESKGRVSFANLSSGLSINGAAYTLLGSVQSLASAIAGNPAGNYALAADYDAKADGTYSAAPISTYFTGIVEGLGNAIANLRVNDRVPHTNVGLFAEIVGGTVADLVLTNVHIQGRRLSAAGGLVGVNDGNVVHDSVSGSVNVDDSNVGGLVGENGNSISRSSSSAAVSNSGKHHSIGGLAGGSGGNFAIDSSFATGPVTAGNGAYAGGFVGILDGAVTNSYATGPVSAGTDSLVGGFAGEAFLGNATSYSTGAVQGGAGSYVGGFAGDVEDTTFNDCYWDTITSGTDQGIGRGNASGITGLTTTQFQSALPSGFDPAIWNEQSKINDGFPYLLTNPPSK